MIFHNTQPAFPLPPKPSPTLAELLDMVHAIDRLETDGSDIALHTRVIKARNAVAELMNFIQARQTKAAVSDKPCRICGSDKLLVDAVSGKPSDTCAKCGATGSQRA